MKKIMSAFAVMTLMTSSAFGQSLVTPTSIAYITSPNQEENGIGGSLNDETRIIDGSGLPSTPTFANFFTLVHASVNLGGAATANAWATVDIGPAGGDFFAEGGIAPVFDMAVGNETNIDSLIVWDYHFGSNNGNHPSLVDLQFSNDNGATFFASRLGLIVPITTGANGLPSQTTFAPVTGSVNFIRMTVTDNHFGIGNGGDRVGIAEIRFTTAIPEPSSALILLGLGGLVGLRRRR